MAVWRRFISTLSPLPVLWALKSATMMPAAKNQPVVLSPMPGIRLMGSPPF
jgi:hypothetical protein